MRWIQEGFRRVFWLNRMVSFYSREDLYTGGKLIVFLLSHNILLRRSPCIQRSCRKRLILFGFRGTQHLQNILKFSFLLFLSRRSHKIHFLYHETQLFHGSGCTRCPWLSYKKCLRDDCKLLFDHLKIILFCIRSVKYLLR